MSFEFREEGISVCNMPELVEQSYRCKKPGVHENTHATVLTQDINFKTQKEITIV